jgi:hypothetical protein
VFGPSRDAVLEIACIDLHSPQRRCGILAYLGRLCPVSRRLFQGAFPDLSDGRVSLSMVTSVEPTTPSAAPTNWWAKEIYPNDGSLRRCRRSAPASPPAVFDPVQDIQSQEATSRGAVAVCVGI